MAARELAKRSPTEYNTSRAEEHEPSASPGVARSLAELRRRYSKFAVSADNVRADLDRTLGDRLLSSDLDVDRGR